MPREMTEEEDLLLDCWLQFSIMETRSDGKRHTHGCLSTLESLERYLRSKDLIDDKGNPR